MTSDSLIAPTPPWMTRTRTSSLESFSSDGLDRLRQQPCTSALTMRFRFFISPSWIWLKRSSSVTLVTGLVGLGLLLLPCAAPPARRAMRSSATALKVSPAPGTSPRPVISTGTDGPALVMLLALVVGHDTDTAHGGAGDDDIALMQRTVLHQQRGDGAAALVQTGLDDGALSGAVGVGLQLAAPRRSATTISSRLSTPIPVLAEIGHTMVSPPHSSGTRSYFGELLLDALGVGVRLIHLVDGHDDGDARRPWRG